MIFPDLRYLSPMIKSGGDNAQRLKFFSCGCYATSRSSSAITLHIALVTGAYALTVGDRLLTTSNGSTVSEWDPIANKTLFVEGTNGRASISYSGLAHIDRKQTDVWLIDQILGGQRPVGPNGVTPGFQFGGPPLGLSLGEMFRRIEAGIRTRLPKQKAARHGLNILIAGMGWPRRPGRPRPFVRSISHNGNPRSSCRINSRRVPHALASPAPLSIWQIGATRQVYAERIMAEMRSIDGVVTEKLAEMILAGVIRDVARMPNSTVGANLVSVHIPFMPGLPVSARFLRDADDNRRPDAFTPAVIVSDAGMIVPPARFIGGSPSLHWGGQDLVFGVDPAPSTPGSLSQFVTQVPKKAPRADVDQ